MQDKKELRPDEICANVAALVGLEDDHEIANWFGVPPGNIQRWKKRGFIPEPRLGLVASTHGVRREWLKFGEKPEWEELAKAQHGGYKMDGDQFRSAKKIAESKAYRDFTKASLRLNDDSLNMLIPIIKAIRQQAT